MFLRFIKPKGKKHYNDAMEYHHAHNVYAFFGIAKIMSYIMWFLCIPFLLVAYSDTIGIFLKITIACIVTDLLAKLFHHDYKYF